MILLITKGELTRRINFYHLFINIFIVIFLDTSWLESFFCHFIINIICYNSIIGN